jgi:enoyl-[acyl-carrier-protein] reductase (NADH)
VAEKSKTQQKLDEERSLKENWREKYFFLDNKGSIICMIYEQSVRILKQYNSR